MQAISVKKCELFGFYGCVTKNQCEKRIANERNYNP